MQLTVLDFIKAIEKNQFYDKDMGECRLVRQTPVKRSVLQQVMSRYDLTLPESYIEFLSYAGAADYFGARFLPPHSLFVLDETNWEMHGLVPFAADSLGNFFAFNPKAGRTEYAVYKCSHDPFGYAHLADSFDIWIKLHYIFIEKIATGRKSFNHPYFAAEQEIFENYKRYKKSLPRKWWQVWK